MQLPSKKLVEDNNGTNIDKQGSSIRKKYSKVANNMIVMTTIVVSLASLLAVISIILTAATLLPTVTTAAAQSSSNNIYPADSKPFGRTYGDWSTAWWQWSVSIPTDKSPLKDNTGINCIQGQSGPVWFLAGTFGGAAERTCTIPAGKAIMFPVYNGECSYVEYPQYKTESELRNCAKAQIDKVTNLAASIDGTSIPDIKKYRSQSPLFDLNLPNNNVFGLSPGPTKSVADGFWIILQPLSAGKHDIHFSGSAVDFTSSGVQNFATSATYHLTVQ
jgi:hypothetical protein